MKLEAKTYKLLDSVKLSFQCAPWLTFLMVLEKVLAGLVPSLQIIATAYFIDTAVAVFQGQAVIREIYWPIGAIAGLIALSWVSGQLIQFVKVRLETALREQFRTAILSKRSKLAYQHIENSGSWDMISRVSKNPENQLMLAFSRVLNAASLILRIVGILAILVAQVWWAALVITTISVPLFYLAMKSGKANYQASREASKYQRRHEYLSKVLMGRDAVNERAIFQYSGAINQVWHEQYETARKIQLRTEMKWYMKMKSGSIITALLSTIIVFLLIPPAVSGSLSIGMFISLSSSIFNLVSIMSWGLTRLADEMARDAEYMVDLTQFSKMDETRGADHEPAADRPVFESLEFRNVHFTYPGADQPTLQGLSFRLEAGKHYAVVGINGAGKTTITKLMTGLYSSYEGEILLNGRELSEYGYSELKAFYSMVYQDFAKYSITLKENIALGDLTADKMEPAFATRLQAAVEQTGLSAVAERLASGIDTALGKIKSNSSDLSGGEWQRVAMARAVFNPAPVRILDEPTAALDPISESRLYEEFEAVSQGTTSLMISHRLGSTKLADEILVIGEGRLLEQGTHKELMELGGVYAQMYEKQRSWYQ
ncbi:ABC transporter ATP-binding protein [Paenibacillus senegalensis]|uniref:ABC transporter ATP-binding protein n=1 Tax=Paenibacillus senegalensis TaxID=1465766 RepID=UPI000288DB22|nr:ABC transporter ATP-binding protein [Paenibacillus senegalensis]